MKFIKKEHRVPMYGLLTLIFLIVLLGVALPIMYSISIQKNNFILFLIMAGVPIYSYILLIYMIFKQGFLCEKTPKVN